MKKIFALISFLICFKLYALDLGLYDSTLRLSIELTNATTAKRELMVENMNGKIYTLAGRVSDALKDERGYYIIIEPVKYVKSNIYLDNEYNIDWGASTGEVHFKVYVNKETIKKYDQYDNIEILSTIEKLVLNNRRYYVEAKEK